MRSPVDSSSRAPHNLDPLLMAASTQALTPTHSGPFGNGLETQTTINVKSLAPLSHPSQRASHSPRSPRAMSPLLSPNTQSRSDEKTLSATAGAAAEAAHLARAAATKISTPLANAVKSISISENGSTSNVQTSPTSMSSVGSLDQRHATTSTAGAPGSSIPLPEDSTPGRPMVDPGLPGASDATPNRAFTFPPPLGDDLHTPAGRNLSLPNNVFAGGSPKSGGSGSKRHKCPYCSTEFTRHHNLKSHLLTHSQEKPYECQQCQARFRRLHDLKRHTKLHTGERPHECARCGRRFARGDALARHAKGPGGCAGRRPSFIEEDPSGTRVDDSMDGVEYTAEPEHMDDSEELNGDHRSTLDSNKRSRTDSYRPATYPGVAPHQGIPPMYPTSTPRSRDESISSQHGQLAPIQHYNAGSQVFQQGVTESPKPLSPGQPADHRGSGRQLGASPILPPPGSSAHLPSLQSFAPHGTHTSNSLSSAGSGTGNGANGQEAWELVRQLQTSLNQTKVENEAFIARLRNDHAIQEKEHRRQLSELADENQRLKSQLKDSSGSSSGAGKNL